MSKLHQLITTILPQTKIQLFCLVMTLLSVSSFTIYPGNQDLLFDADIARNFLLLDELEEKKFVLLGPRTSTAGLFHGPLWTYVNYPAYFLGQGDPVFVAWSWIFITIAWLFLIFFLTKKVFGKDGAWVSVSLFASMMVFHVHQFNNPHGALFLLPFLFLLFTRITKNKIHLFWPPP